MAEPDFIPDAQFTPDPSSQPAASGPAPASAPDFIPDGQFQSDQDTYGSPSEMLKTAIEQTASGATLGLSKVAETHLLGVDPAAIEARERENKITSFMSNILGTGATIAATGGLGLAGEGAGLAVKAGAGALEGGAIGGINQATDDWSQNKALDAQKIAASAGLGALIGGTLTGAVEGVRSKFFSPVAKVAPAAEQSAVDSGGVPPSDGSGGGGGGGAAATELPTAQPAPETIVDAPQPDTIGVKPTSYADIASRVNDAKYSGNAIEMPQAGMLQDAASRIEMSNPINPLQVDSLKTQAARDAYQTFKEMPGDVGDTLRGYESLQKNELVGKTLKTISDLSPGSSPVADAVQGGKTAIDAFTDQYQSEKAALKPVFDQLHQLPYNGDLLVDTVGQMTQSLPKIANMFDYEGGDLSIKPYRTSMGIDEATYKAVKQSVDSLQDETVPDSFQKLWDIRKGLDQNVDVTAQGQAPAEIGLLRKGLMQQMEQSAPSQGVKDTFQRYALNEAQRGVIEKAFGASVGTPEFGAISKIKPEYIGDRIFGNTATVSAAKSILPKDQFNTVLANWLQENAAKVTDKGVFSSNKFGTFLRTNQDALNAAFSDKKTAANPAALQRFRDLTTLMRVLPDSPSVNPSGTAKTIFRMVTGMKLHDMTWEGLLASIPQKVVSKVGQQLQMRELNKALAGQAVKNSARQGVQSAVIKTTGRIDSGIKALIGGAASQSRKAQ